MPQASSEDDDDGALVVRGGGCCCQSSPVQAAAGPKGRRNARGVGPRGSASGLRAAQSATNLPSKLIRRTGPPQESAPVFRGVSSRLRPGPMLVATTLHFAKAKGISGSKDSYPVGIMMTGYFGRLLLSFCAFRNAQEQSQLDKRWQPQEDPPVGEKESCTGSRPEAVATTPGPPGGSPTCSFSGPPARQRLRLAWGPARQLLLLPPPLASWSALSSRGPATGAPGLLPPSSSSSTKGATLPLSLCLNGAQQWSCQRRERRNNGVPASGRAAARKLPLKRATATLAPSG